MYLLQAHEGDHLVRSAEACPETSHSPGPHRGASTGRPAEHMSPAVDQGHITGAAQWHQCIPYQPHGGCQPLGHPCMQIYSPAMRYTVGEVHMGRTKLGHDRLHVMSLSVSVSYSEHTFLRVTDIVFYFI